MNININNGINVEYTLTPIKHKSDKTKYAIYLVFKIYQNGIKQDKKLISTGIDNINVSDWKNGAIIGRNDKAKHINERLNAYLSTSKQFLVGLQVNKIKTCTDVLNEIISNVSQLITGKAPRGQKDDFISKMKDYAFESVMQRLIDERQLHKDRANGYKRSSTLLTDYFKGKVPTIDQITSEDLEGFKEWFLSKNPDLSKNTVTDYLSKMAAVFKYALKKKILIVNPIPEKFRGSFVDADRAVLNSKEIMLLMNLDDKQLNKPQQVAKYSLLVQLLTGMAYCDLVDVGHENIKYDDNEQMYYIIKPRCKDKGKNTIGVTFRVFLSANGLHMVNKLKELTGNEEKPFNLTGLANANKHYKNLRIMAGIKTNLTTYTLRHSYAVDFMENDGRIEDLAVELGHTQLKTTQIYGKISNKRLAEKKTQLQSKSKMHQLQPMLKAV